MKRPTKSVAKKSSAKKDHSAAVHPAQSFHHSASHKSEHHDHSHQPAERRARPRGDDIFTKIQDATEKVLREKKHLIKK